MGAFTRKNTEACDGTGRRAARALGMRLVIACAIGVGITASPALAQFMGVRQFPPPKPKPVAPPSALMTTAMESTPLLQPLSVDEAVLEARKKTRLVVIFWAPGDPQDPAWAYARCQVNPSVRAYMTWHATSVASPTLPAWLWPQVCEVLKQQHEKTPAVIVLRGREIETVIGTGRAHALGLETSIDRHHQPSACGPTAINPPDQFTAKPPRVLFQTDFALERIAAKDPVWYEKHVLDNPPPAPPPEGEPICVAQDDLAMVVRDPLPDEHMTPLDRLDLARRLWRSGDLHSATGLYSWLWERGDVVDPAFRSAKLSAVASDIAAIALKRAGSMERFEKIRTERTKRLFWADYGGMHEWFVLSSATNDIADVVEYLDRFINDDDEGTLLPPTDAAAFNMLSRRTDFAKAWEQPKSPVDRVRAIVGMLGTKFPSSTLPKAREQFAAFVRQYLVDEGARLHVASLISGDDESAAEIGRIVLEARNDSAARLALIVTALAADPPQARPMHLRWLDEAEANDAPKRPDLRARLLTVLGSPATSPGNSATTPR